ncbi:hypothetical protein [Streptomyces prasinopilosus]|uniref:hypothetical protein n=1 Tax=Streptomyces prasinopilosus TaxID=67344 RepID=UPI0006EBC960|nr:hypothetical protein [Streptomyces prasinopilosus]
MAQRAGDVTTRAPATVEPPASVTVVARTAEVTRGHAAGVVSPADPAVERGPEPVRGALGAARPDA